MIRLTLNSLKTFELIYHSLMISLDKSNGSCNAADSLYTKLCVPSKTKDVNVKVFKIITRINEAKTLLKHISVNYKYNLDSIMCNSSQKWNNEMSI